jgi:hypothetical protein
MNIDQSYPIIGFLPVVLFVFSLLHFLGLIIGKSSPSLNTTISTFIISTSLCTFGAWMAGLSNSLNFSYLGILSFVGLNVIGNGLIFFLLFKYLKSSNYNANYFLNVPRKDAMKKAFRMTLILIILLPASYFLMSRFYYSHSCESTRCRAAVQAFGNPASGPTMVWIYCILITPAFINLFVSSAVFLIVNKKSR